MSMPRPTLTVRAEERGDVTVIHASGAIDYWSVGQLRRELDESLAAEIPRIVLDLYGVPFCDSSGLAALLAAQQRARAAGGWLRVARPHLQMRRVLAVTRLDRRIHSYASIQDAINGQQERTR